MFIGEGKKIQKQKREKNTFSNTISCRIYYYIYRLTTYTYVKYSCDRYTYCFGKITNGQRLFRYIRSCVCVI